MNRSYVTTGDVPAMPGGRLAPQLADELLETYLWWRQESAAVQSAYLRWRDALADDRAFAFSEYRAAVDLEEQAAGVFRECSMRVSETA